MKLRLIALTATLSTLGILSSHGANNASDNASNYSGFGGSTPNNGTGFGAWSFNNSGGGEYLGGTGLSANSFGVYSGSDTGFGTATRQLTGGALTTGQAFSLQIGSTTIDSGGAVGVNLLDGSTTVFTLQASTASGDWQLNDGGSNFDTTIPFNINTAVSFKFTYDGGNTYNVNMTEGASNYASGIFTASDTLSNITAVKVFSAFQGGSQNAGFDNLSVTSPAAVPEPSTWAMLLLSVTGLAFMARRRKA